MCICPVESNRTYLLTDLSVLRSRKVEAELVDSSVDDKRLNDSGPPAKLAHSGCVTQLAVEVTSSYQLLVSGGQDHYVKVWSVLNSQLMCTLTTHTHSVRLSVCLYVCPSVCLSGGKVV